METPGTVFSADGTVLIAKVKSGKEFFSTELLLTHGIYIRCVRYKRGSKHTAIHSKSFEVLLIRGNHRVSNTEALSMRESRYSEINPRFRMRWQILIYVTCSPTGCLYLGGNRTDST
jgi:hypothetical protein